ncbi:hypothetical protein HZI73_00305 [Vallitalea pronyensis]|uniref:Uncharacterized protein n=1 Tax=Vallitalea pronyensis TaxID=1348613 RepID=A0A8J8MGK3_9FIRM|nr:hypothetical protein [Vallitalea pronyensis]QUI20843.1 hypothetical protein HZI73_00305 [Vallitalea pronyensis]
MVDRSKINHDIQLMVDTLLNMKPDPIPYFILLKEFKKVDPSEKAYVSAYEKVLEHSFVREIEKTQTQSGYWGEFHGYTEEMIRRCLNIGLDPKHPCLIKVCNFIETILRGEEIWHQRCEKHDNPRWWLEIFMPLVSASILSLVDPKNPLLRKHVELWRYFTQSSFAEGTYNSDIEMETQYNYFKINTKRKLPFYNYYTILLLTSQKDILSPTLDKKMLDYCMHKEDGMYYIYEGSPTKSVSIHDTKDFYKWLRLLTIYKRFKSWNTYETPYYQWIWNQRNSEGLWDMIKRPRGFYFPLSNSWRTQKNRIIDSSICALRLLTNYHGF